MYTICQDPQGTIPVCHDCSHVEHIDEFKESLGSCCTKAARAMQNQSRDKHGAGLVLKPTSKNSLVTSWTVPISRKPH
jgi:hypothetical protein